MPSPITPANAQIPADNDAPVVVDFDVHALRVALVQRQHVLKLSAAWAPDLLAAGLLSAGALLTFQRAGKTAEASVTADGQLVVDGKAYSSPSRAASTSLGLKAANGWVSWRLDAGAGPTLADLRAQLPGASDKPVVA